MSLATQAARHQQQWYYVEPEKFGPRTSGLSHRNDPADVTHNRHRTLDVLICLFYTYLKEPFTPLNTPNVLIVLKDFRMAKVHTNSLKKGFWKGGHLLRVSRKHAQSGSLK